MPVDSRGGRRRADGDPFRGLPWPCRQGRPLVEAELGKPGSYKKGHAFYELTKPELVQEKKEVAIVENATGKIYAGDAARTVLGLPIGERIKLKPGDHGGFSIFVQSTSVNRQLVAGTSLLYRKSA